MRVALLEEIKSPITVVEKPEPEPRHGEALVYLHAAALNHRDVYIQQGLYANIQTPVVLGSDGAGTCHGGREVIICPSFHWGENSRAQGAEYQILGMPQDGTFSDQICVPESHLFPKPEHLSWEEAAALPLAGLTAWRALFTKCDLQEGEKVLITGIGGGVALIAFQLAMAKGAHVWVSSGSDEKIQSALDMGAQGGVNYKQETWHKTLKERAEGFDVIIDSAGGDGFAKLPAMCNPGARIAIYGGTQGKISGLSPQIVFWKQISIHGTSMGTLEEFGKMLAFVDEHKIQPIVDHVMELEKVNEAMDRMDKGDQFGKIVLRLAGTPD